MVARPYQCPKCSGFGWLQYNPDNPWAMSTNSGPWQCPPCLGVGVIWALDDSGPAIGTFKTTAVGGPECRATVSTRDA